MDSFRDRRFLASLMFYRKIYDVNIALYRVREEKNYENRVQSAFHGGL